MTAGNRKYAVNWQSGMKVRTDHFIALENWIIESLQETALLTMDAYGILPPTQAMESSLKLQQPVASGDEIQVVLHACRVVTAGGFRFTRREEENALAGVHWIEGKYKRSGDKHQDLSVILSISPFSRSQIGDPDEETPPRRPYVMPEATLKIVPVETPWNPVEEVKLAEIKYEGGAYIFSKEYIPPCVAVNSLPLLVERHRQWLGVLNTMYANSLDICRRLQLSMPKGFDAMLIEYLYYAVRTIAAFLADHLSQYRLLLPTASPRRWVEFFVCLAHNIHLALESQDDYIKNKLLEYFQQWAGDFQPGPFGESVAQLMSLNLNHESLYSAIVLIEKLMNQSADLLKSLAERKYEPLVQS